MKTILLIITGTVLLFTKHSEGQIFTQYNFKFKTYTTQDGLVHNFTRKCKQDSRGFLWIITENGLSRFDGYQFRNFQHDPSDSTSLPFNDLLDMDIDDKDRIWLAYTTGLCLYDQQKQEFIKIPGVDQSITLVYDGVLGQVWFTSMQNGLRKVNVRTLEVSMTRLTGPFQGTPQCMGIDQRRNIWIGLQRNSSFRYDINTGQFTDTKKHYWARSFDTDERGGLWISSWAEGFQYLDRNTDTSATVYLNTPLNSGGIQFIYQGIARSEPLTGKEILWVVLHNGGIALFDRNKREFVKWMRYDPSLRSGIPNDYNSSIYSDRNGIIWVCNWYGLAKVNKQEQQFQSAEIPLLKTDLYNLLAGIADDPKDPAVSWVAVEGSGIFKFDRLQNKLMGRFLHDLQKDYWWIWTQSLTQDKAGRIWIPGYEGLIRIENGKVHTHPLNWNKGRIFPKGAAELQDGMIWLWSSAGLVRFDPVKYTYEFFRDAPLNDRGNTVSEFIDLVQDRSGMIYTASIKGAFQFDIRSKKFSAISLPIKNTDLRSMASVNDYVFFGSEEGLVMYHTTRREARLIGKEQGVNNLIQNSLRADKSGKLWIYTLHGLFRYDPAKDEFKKFTTEDGIYNNSNDKLQFFSYNDTMYLGYRMAFTRFDPNQIDVNKNIAKPYITGITVAGLDRKIWPDSFSGEDLKLKHPNNTIEIDFTAIDYTNSERISFAYKLDGFDKDWISAGTQRSIRYSNLRGGHYTFRVKAANSSGLWNDEPAVIRFYIQPPLLQRWWVKTLIGLLIFTGLYALYKWRIRQLRKKQKEKTYRQQLEIERYKQELELEQISSFFSGSLVQENNIKEVLNEVAKNLIGKLGFEDCMIYLWNEDKTKLVQQAGYGLKGEVEFASDKERYNITRGKGVIGAAVESGKPVLVNDTATDPRYFSADGIHRKSELCVPLIDDGTVIGAINIEQSDKDHFTAHHQQIVSTIATLVVNKLKAIQSSQSLHQKELELAETELAMLRSQMNPHFIFNSLNSVQKYIWENNEEDAAEYLAKFAKLMRAILENSRKSMVSLAEEIETVKLYTELEHRRSNGRFDYSIRIADDIEVEKTAIPPLLLQPFIENAVWHGLNKKAGKGSLAIEISRSEDLLVCIVDDDGVGRTPTTASVSGKKSLGIEITRQRIESLMRSSGKRGSITITDKNENGKPAGTKVIITLPIQLLP